MLTLRRAAATSTLLLLAPLAACGGDDATSAPTDASKEDFCTAYGSIFDALLGGDAEQSEKEREDAAVKGLQDWAEKMKEVGTPDELSDDARKGFELILDEADDIDDASDLEDIEEDYSDEETKQAEALQTWVTKNCGDEIMPDVPEMDTPELEELPSESETDLP